MIIARVAIDKATAQFDREYDYRVPDSLNGKLKAGCRVVVPFGNGNKSRTALVLTLREEEGTKKLKEILQQADENPILGLEELALLGFLKEQTFCQYFDAFKTIVPPGIGGGLVDGLSVRKGVALPEELPPESVGIYHALLNKKKPADEKNR